MADRNRRSVAKPIDYKKLNDKGREISSDTDSEDKEAGGPTSNSSSMDTSGGSEVIINNNKTSHEQQYTDTANETEHSDSEIDNITKASNRTQRLVARSDSNKKQYTKKQHGQHGDHTVRGDSDSSTSNSNDLHSQLTQDYTNKAQSIHTPVSHNNRGRKNGRTKEARLNTQHKHDKPDTPGMRLRNHLSKHSRTTKQQQHEISSANERDDDHDHPPYSNDDERNHNTQGSDTDNNHDRSVLFTDRRSHSKPKGRMHKGSTNGHQEQDQLDLTVDPDQDDLDMDQSRHSHSISHGNSGENNKSKANKKDQKGARPKSPSKRVQVSPTKSISPKKSKQTVAARLLSLPTPIKSPTKTVRKSRSQPKQNLKPKLHDDELFIIESRKADQELENARRLLLHSEREAELASRRLEAEELRKKSIQAQKQADRTNKKADVRNARYELQRQHTTSVINDNTYAEIPHNSNANSDEVIRDGIINRTKSRVKILNPLRRARKTFTGTDGSNNPNIQGQDNGANAWMDAQLNEDLDDKIKLQTKYAKRNSDRNRCYDIDDVPIRGPNAIIDDDIQSIISINEATNTANELLNEDNLYICRNTGMMMQKQDNARTTSQSRNSRRPPSSTVTRMNSRHEEPHHSRDRGYQHDREWSHDHRRYDQTDHDGWESLTESESGLDRNITNKKKIVTKRSKKL